MDVLDRAQVQLALVRAVLGDVSEPEPVGCRCGEVPLDQVVMNGRAGLARQSAFLGEHRPDSLAATQPLDPVLTRGQALLLQLVCNEPLAERRVVPMHI